mmetsp:Transcript_1132/g.1517  ORF Transcript_1132/g.1517 Transcript_1132/m.1517 type:complete len:270 (-) Transcript_1132:108-917(-)
MIVNFLPKPLQKKEKYVIALLLLLILMVSTQFDSIVQSDMPLQATNRQAENPNNVLYGHIHIARTGGTSLNRQIATNYERVCGNKGFTNHLRFKYIKNNNLMESTNFDECDFISTEKDYTFWDQFEHQGRPVELHVPCKNPVSHLMSMVNYDGKAFGCGDGIAKQIDDVSHYVTHRFSQTLSQKENFALKCFDTSNTDKYVEYMAHNLEYTKINRLYKEMEKKKFHLQEDECVWEYPKMMDFIRKYMIDHFDYYAFCEECIGSTNDLFL